MKSPTDCRRLHAIAGGYKQTCFKQNANAGGFPQVVGDFMQLKKGCFRVVVKFRRNTEWNIINIFFIFETITVRDEIIERSNYYNSDIHYWLFSFILLL